MTIRSKFAILDVLSGYRELPKTCDPDTSESIDVVIRGTITHCYGDHDGTSREYVVDVKSVGRFFGLELRTYLYSLLRAIEVNDPRTELRARVEDILRNLST